VLLLDHAKPRRSAVALSDMASPTKRSNSVRETTPVDRPCQRLPSGRAADKPLPANELGMDCGTRTGLGTARCTGRGSEGMVRA